VPGLLGLLFLASIASCGGAGTQGTPDGLTDSEVGTDPDLLADGPTGDGPADERVGPVSRFEILVNQQAEGCYGQLVTRPQPVSVTVVDYVQDTLAVGAALEFAITSIVDLQGTPVAEGDATLNLTGSATGEQGTAGVVFRCGETGGLTYTVTVSTPDLDATPKTFCVTCSDVPRGCLEVQVTGPTDGTVSDVQVAVLPGHYACDMTATPRAEFAQTDLLTQIEVPNLNTPIRIENLPEGPVTLMVRARWADLKGGWVPPGGVTDACFSLYSCRDAVNVLPDQCKSVSASLDMWPLMPSGVYDCVDRFDFAQMIQQCAGGDTSTVDCVAGAADVGKTVCCTLAELTKLFDTPGGFLVDNIAALAKQALPAIFVNAVMGLFRDAVVKALDKLIADNAPPWVKDFLKSGAAFVSTITTVELLSDLTLSKPQSNNDIEGSQYWTGLAVNWMGTRKVFSLTQLEGGTVPLKLIGGGYLARIEKHDRLIISSHDVSLNYGRLVLFVLNEVVISGLTNGAANSVQEAITLWIDCKKVAAGIVGDIASWFGSNDPKIIEDACVGALALAAPLLPQFLDALKLDTSLRMYGSAVLADEDCDLDSHVEHITRGAWTGSVQSAGAVQGDFTGTFEATRKGHPTN
jgi:hypothetical protein